MIKFKTIQPKLSALAGDRKNHRTQSLNIYQATSALNVPFSQIQSVYFTPIFGRKYGVIRFAFYAKRTP